MNTPKYTAFDAEIMLFFKPFNFKFRTFTRKYYPPKPMNYLDAFVELGLELAKKENVFFKQVIRTLKPSNEETNQLPDGTPTRGGNDKLPNSGTES